MSHRPGQKTSAARASDSYPPVPPGDRPLRAVPNPPGSATQTPPFYHPLFLLVHLRPTEHPPPSPRNPPRPSSTTPFYRDVPRDGQPRLHVESALHAHTRAWYRGILVYTHIHACIADSVSYSVSVLVNRYRRSLRPPSSLPSLPPSPPCSPLVVFLPTNARISSPHFSRVLPRYRADSLSLSLSLSPVQRCRKPSPRHRCRGPDGQWVQWTITVVYFS